MAIYTKVFQLTMVLDDVQLVYSVQAGKAKLGQVRSPHGLGCVCHLPTRLRMAKSKATLAHSQLGTVDHYQKGSLMHKPGRKEGVDVQHTRATLQVMGRSQQGMAYSQLSKRDVAGETDKELQWKAFVRHASCYTKTRKQLSQPT